MALFVKVSALIMICIPFVACGKSTIQSGFINDNAEDDLRASSAASFE